MISRNVVYKEDVSTVASGEVLVDYPCVVRAIIVSCETSGAGILSLANSASSYTSANRNGKIVVNGTTTVSIEYPRGKNFTSGIAAQANKASMDIEIVFD